MNTTQYYSLGQPLPSEKYSVLVQNTNMDIIDSTLNEIESKNNNLNDRLNEHIEDNSNPHKITKSQVGLGNVENKSSSIIRSEITKDNVISALGYTPYTPNEIDNKFSVLESAIYWKEAVETYDDIAITYPEPEDGWTVNVNDTDYTYRYNGIEWIVISANAIPKATSSIDGLLSKEDYNNYEEAYNKRHTHNNKDIIDNITQDMIDKWNSNNNMHTVDVPSRYVVATHNGLYYCDSNDESYDLTSLIDYENNNFIGVIYAEEQNKFVALKTKSIMYSYDAINWTSINLSSLLGYENITNITYGNGYFVCVAGRYILYSTDVINWTIANSNNTDTTVIYKDVCYGNDKFVAVGYNGLSCYSTNGKDWTEMEGLNSEDYLSYVVYGNNKFVCGNANKIYYSLDGLTWQSIDFTFDSPLSCLTYGNGYFVCGTNNFKTYYSIDGVQWMSSTVSESYSIPTIIYVNNKFFGLTTIGNIYISDNVIEWTHYKTLNTNPVSIAYSPETTDSVDKYVTREELKEYAQPIIQGNGIKKITYRTTEPETIEEGEIVFVYEE